MENRKLEECLKNNLRECQLKQVQMLKCLHEICKKHNLNYWLDGGTLLGAVRHGGFIPWDDDIDVGMDSESYYKFKQIAASELPESIFLQTKTSDPQVSYTMKLRDNNSFGIGPDDNLDCSYHKGLALDIFEFIPYPSKCKKLVKFITRKICVTNIFLEKSHKLTMKTMLISLLLQIRYPFLKLLWGVLKLFKSDKYLANVPVNNVYGIIHKTTSVYPLAEIRFEGELFSCPADSDAYLSDLYKNYMTLPPENKRKSHLIYSNPCLVK